MLEIQGEKSTEGKQVTGQGDQNLELGDYPLVTPGLLARNPGGCWLVTPGLPARNPGVMGA